MSATRPARYDRNLVVIGAGAAGLVSAYVAAAAGARVTLVERHRMGGECLYTGCVPSKALIRSAKLLSQMRRAADFGFRRVEVDFSFADVMARVRRVIGAVEPHDSPERYTRLGVECLAGEARLESPRSVNVGGTSLTTRAVIVATGAEAAVPPVPGLAETGYLTADSVWGLKSLPARLLVLGGGPVGVEFAQCFARFGAKVVLVEMQPAILSREDPEVSGTISECLRAEGVAVLAGHKPLWFHRDGNRKLLSCDTGDGTIDIPFDEVLVAAGRKARVSGFGLEALGVGLAADGTLATDDCLQTSVPGIYACGDVTGPYQYTHMAAHQAWYAAINALFGGIRRFRVDYSLVPRAIFTDPEVARVGLDEGEARSRGVPYEVTRYDLSDLDRAITDGHAEGFVKVLTAPGRDRILGVTIVGENAAEILAEFTGAMKHGVGLNGILATIHAYPTFSEAAKNAAGAWRRARPPRLLLKLAKRYLEWKLK